MKKEEVLQQCTIEGNVVKLPNIKLDRKEYLEVKKALELIGGKWKGGKVSGFVFSTDPTDLLKSIASGEKRNLKKEFQFFATPPELADKLVMCADLQDGDLVLEPSAGQGAIVEAIQKKPVNVNIEAIELMETNSKILEQKGINHFRGDFLKHNIISCYDVIIANPPFTKNQDIVHLQHMYGALKDGGRLVCITSTSWFTGSQKKQIAFKKWLEEVGAEILDIEPGTFKKSGTMVGGKVVIIDK